MHRILIVLLLLCMHLPAAAKDVKWVEVSSEHFLLFTDTNEAKGRRLLQDFENRAATLAQVLGKLPPRQFPIEVFLFNEEVDFLETLPRVQPQPSPAGQPAPLQNPSPLGPPQNENPFRKSAYLVRGADRIFIVARDKSPDDISNDVGHALGHVLFERYVMWKPFWLAEGVAEYVRKIGKSADTKRISEDEGFSVEDLFTIVPSVDYNDDDPPTVFRPQSYRLFRFMLQENADVLRQYIQTLRADSDKTPKIGLDGESIQDKFNDYTETPLRPLPIAPVLKAVEPDTAKLAIHRGNLLAAAGRESEASRWYNGDTKEARAARAILTRFSRQPAESIRVLERAARELPEDGLVQYHFGAIETKEPKDLQLQIAALERATQLLPLMGRASGELARVYVLSGQTDKVMPLLAKAAELEPEYAALYYETRADLYIAEGKFQDAIRAINTASELPHFGSSPRERYLLKTADVRKRIEAARREVDAKELAAIRSEVEARREPPPKPAPPPPPVPIGSISYEIETRAPIEVVHAVFPDYPEPLRAKGAAGQAVVQVDIGPDGKVTNASIVNTQLQDLNKAVLDSVKKWTFKPGNRSIRLVLRFSLTP